MIKRKLIKRLNEIILEITKANDAELDKIGVELLEIEKKLMSYKTKAKPKLDLSFGQNR